MALPLRVALDTDRIDAAPGDARTVVVTVRNTSDIVEHYIVEVLGLPAGGTAATDPAVTKLRPGEEATVTVRLAVPANPPAPAGRYTLGMLVRSKYRGAVSRCEELPLTLAATEDVSVRVEPEVATGGRSARYTVRVSNGGNVPVRLGLAVSDPERRVAGTFEPTVVDLPQGTSALSYLTVAAAVPWNKEAQRTLTVEATGAGVRSTGRAQFVQRPRFASKLVRVAGMAGAVLALAGAVVVAAIIAKPDAQPEQANATAAPPPATAPPVATAGPATAPPTTAPPTTAPATGGGEAPQPPQPRQVDLTRPQGRPAEGVLPSDAFRQDGLILGGAPDPGGPPDCAAATAVAVRAEGGQRSLAAAKPDDPAACNFVPVQIRLLTAVREVRVVLAGDAPRQFEVFYRDLSRSVETDLRVVDDGSRGGIDFLLIRGVPADQNSPAPPAAVRALVITPAQ